MKERRPFNCPSCRAIPYQRQLTCGLEVDLDVVGVLELLEHEGVGRAGEDADRLLDRARHAQRCCGAVAGGAVRPGSGWMLGSDARLGCSSFTFKLFELNAVSHTS